MIPSIEFSVGIIIGFLFWNLFAGEYEGHRIERSIRPIIFGYRIHLHHWIWCTLILILLLRIGDTNYSLIGILAGSIFQGLSYDDRFVVIYKDEDFEKIYSQFKDRD